MPVFSVTPQCPPPSEEEKYDKIIDEKDKIMTDIKSFDLILTNEKFTLELAKSENNKNIILKLYNNKEKALKYYIRYLNIDDFYNLNNFFRFYQSINELYNLLLDIISKKRYSISIKNSLALLVLEFPMPGEKVIDINFELKEEKAKKEELMEQLYGIVTELTEENKKIKEEINNLKNENKKLKEECNKKNEDNINNQLYNINKELKNLKEENIQIKEKLKLLEENINKKQNIIIKEVKEEKKEKEEKIEKIEKIKKKEKKEKIEKKEEKPKNEIIESSPNSIISTKNEIKTEKAQKKETSEYKIIETPKPKKNVNIEDLFKESKLVKNAEDKKNLVNWLTSVGNISEINLIYRATRDGDDSDTFFEKCSNKGPTISLIKSGNDRVFGGFTKAEWTDKKGKIKLKDDKAFLFSLDNKEKYKILKPDIAISCYPNNYTLVYGNKDDRYGIRLFNNFLEKNNYENLASKVYDAPSDYCLSGHNKFEVQDAEVYQVIFE